MATMISEVYDALREAGASEEKARLAAEAVASYDDRFSRIELNIEHMKGELKLVKWMLGLVIVAELLPLLKMLFA